MMSRCCIANTYSSQLTVPHTGTRLKLSKALNPNYTTKTTKSFTNRKGGGGEFPSAPNIPTSGGEKS